MGSEREESCTQHRAAPPKKWSKQPAFCVIGNPSPPTSLLRAGADGNPKAGDSSWFSREKEEKKKLKKLATAKLCIASSPP